MPAVVVGLAVATAASCPPSAVADADPASDVLAIQDVFLPYAQPQKHTADTLAAAVDRVYQRGNRIKVAVIGSRLDLGGVGGLWNQPGHYAKFLGKELNFLFVGPLLIVMPVGFGIYDGGRSTAPARRVLATLRVPGPGSDALTAAAVAAVTRLLDAGALRSKDVLPPQSTTYPSSVRRGEVMKLYYTVRDDGDRARTTLWVTAGRTRVATFRLPLRRLRRHQGSFALPWRVPKQLTRGGARFCVAARDAAGNASPTACAMLSIR